MAYIIKDLVMNCRFNINNDMFRFSIKLYMQFDNRITMLNIIITIIKSINPLVNIIFFFRINDTCDMWHEI